MTKVQDLGFAKLFDFADGQQLAVYADMDNGRPCLRGQTQYMGLFLHPLLAVEGAPVELNDEQRQKIFEILTDGYTVEMAETVRKAIVDNLSKVPALELRKIMRDFRMEDEDPPFAKVIDHEGMGALLLSGQQENQPILTLVTDQGPSVTVFDSVYARDAAFRKGEVPVAPSETNDEDAPASTGRKMRP